MPRTVSTFAATGAAVFALIGLTACAPGDVGPSASPSRSSSASPSSSPSSPPVVPPSVAPTATEGPETPGTAIGVSCLDLVSLDTMYRFDPNFGLDDDYAPPAGSLGATAVADGGVACGWVQQTSGEVVEIAAAQPSESALEALRSEAGADDGGRVFSTIDGRGVVQAFVGPHWVIATSTYFGTTDDAALLVDSALAALNG